RCDDCEMCYLNPVFTDEALTQFYLHNNTVQSQVVKNESEFYRRILGKGLTTISRFVKPGRILDMGCSTGFFLDLAREAGWKTWGVELNQAEIVEAEKSGHKVSNSSLEDCGFDEKFDAITMWDVFEHIKDGRALLYEIRRRLAPGGVLFMQTPSF